MGRRDRLRANLLAEGRAYGYTLTVWGVGTMLLQEYGIPTHSDVFAYVGGALAAVAVLAAVAFDSLLGSEVGSDARERPAASIVHVAATLGNLGVSYLIIEAASPGVPPIWVFFLLGFLSTVGYNVLLLFEDRIVYAFH